MDDDEPAAEADFPCGNPGCERRFGTPQGRDTHKTRYCPHRPTPVPTAAPTPAPEPDRVAARRAELESQLATLAAQLTSDSNLDAATPPPVAAAVSVFAAAQGPTASGSFLRFDVPPNIEAAQVTMGRAQAANVGRSAAKAEANGPKLELGQFNWNENVEEFTHNFTEGVKAVFRQTGDLVTLSDALTSATDTTKREHCLKVVKKEPAKNMRKFVKHLLSKKQLEIFVEGKEIDDCSKVLLIPQTKVGVRRVRFRPKEQE